MKLNSISSSDFKFSQKVNHCACTQQKIAHAASICAENPMSAANKTYALNYKNISFGHTKTEHDSWGAKIVKDKNSPYYGCATFKIASFPPENGATPQVFVEIKQRDSDLNTDECWNSSIKTYYISKHPKVVKVEPTCPEKSTIYPLRHTSNGIYELKLEPGIVEYGDEYRFLVAPNRIDLNPDLPPNITGVKDPYSNYQKTIFSWSTVFDHDSYKWSDNETKWQNNKCPEKVSRLAKKEKNGMTKMEDLVMYEINIPTFSKEGNFEGAIKELPKVRELGFNAVKVMPTEGTYGANWGYDGTDKNAPSAHLGGPNGEKAFVDAAHEHGLSVIKDMVPNHIGPEGNFLEFTGDYLMDLPKDHPLKKWGDPFNYEQRGHTQYVQDYICNAAMLWLDKYHYDGLRLDMTSRMGSDKTLKKMAMEIHYHYPHAILIAEDERLEQDRVITPLTPEEECYNKPEQVHDEVIKNYESHPITDASKYLNIGMDSQWYFDYHHSLDALLRDDSSAFWRFIGVIKNAKGRMVFNTSHDESGNNGGLRKAAHIIRHTLDLAGRISSQNGYEIWTSADKAAQELLYSGLSGDYSDMPENERIKFLNDLKIREDKYITPEKLDEAVKNAFTAQRLGMAITHTMPGPKMVLQGEPFEVAPFKFFRRVHNQEINVDASGEKGYDVGESAYQASIMGRFHYDGQDKLELFMKDLNKMTAANPALRDGKIEDALDVHSHTNILGLHMTHPNGNEVYTITNFGGQNYPAYGINFPPGKWKLSLLSNDERYGGTSKFDNAEILSHGEKGYYKVFVPELNKKEVRVYVKVA